MNQDGVVTERKVQNKAVGKVCRQRRCEPGTCREKLCDEQLKNCWCSLSYPRFGVEFRGNVTAFSVKTQGHRRTF